MRCSWYTSCIPVISPIAVIGSKCNAFGTARKIRDTETFIVWTCCSPLLHVYYNGGILECAQVRVRKTKNKFCQLPPDKVSCFEVFIVQMYGLELL